MNFCLRKCVRMLTILLSLGHCSNIRSSEPWHSCRLCLPINQLYTEYRSLYLGGKTDKTSVKPLTSWKDTQRCHHAFIARSLVTETNVLWLLSIAGYGAGILQLYNVRRDSSVCVVIPGNAREFSLTKTSISLLGSTQPRDKWVAVGRAARAWGWLLTFTYFEG